MGGVVSGGSGVSTLRLSSDELRPCRFPIFKLSSPVSGIGIYSGRPVLFDVSASLAQPDGSYIWVFKPRGTFSVADIVAAIKRASHVSDSNFRASCGRVSGAYNLSTGGQGAHADAGAAACLRHASAADAGRFLSQSTFGATDALITKVQSQGFDAFLNINSPRRFRRISPSWTRRAWSPSSNARVRHRTIRRSR